LVIAVPIKLGHQPPSSYTSEHERCLQKSDSTIIMRSV
jgi:hypothetical protein